MAPSHSSGKKLPEDINKKQRKNAIVSSFYDFFQFNCESLLKFLDI